MLATQQVMDVKILQRIEQLLQEFITIATMSKDDIKDALARAKDFFQFIMTHRSDPDNCLIGLSPAEKLIERYWLAREDEESQKGKRKNQNKSSATNSLHSQSSGDLSIPEDAQQKGSPAIATKKAQRGEMNLRMETRESLLLRILEWSECKDPDRVKREMVEFATQIRGEALFRPGDLVMARIRLQERTSGVEEASGEGETDEKSGLSASAGPTSDASGDEASTEGDSKAAAELSSPSSSSSLADESTDGSGAQDPSVTAEQEAKRRAALLQRLQEEVVFARVMEQRPSEGVVVVYVTPHEEQGTELPLEDVMPLYSELRTLLESVDSMKSLTADPVDKLYLLLKDLVSERCRDFLQEQGVSVELLDRLLSGASLSRGDRPLLQRCLDRLTELKGSKLMEEFSGEVGKSAWEELQKLRQRLKESRLFPPTRKQTLNTLANFPLGSLVPNRLQLLIGRCRVSLEKLDYNRARILDGTAKRQLSEWWLEEIEQGVDAFLERSGFNFHAIPEDYIEKPPSDLASINANLRMLREMMNPKNTRFRVGEFVETLRARIYARIDEFLTSLRDVAAEEVAALCAAVPDLQIANSLLTNVDDDPIHGLRRPIAALRKMEHTLNCDQVTLLAQLVELCQDVDYVCEMKRLEKRDIQENNDKGIIMTNIVPVGGLIFSRFYRVENELMTILELWGDNRLRRTASTRRMDEENKRLLEERKGKAAFRELNWEKLEKKRNVKIMRIFLTQHHFKTIPVELPACAQDVCDSMAKKLRDKDTSKCVLFVQCDGKDVDEQGIPMNTDMGKLLESWNNKEGSYRLIFREGEAAVSLELDDPLSSPRGGSPRSRSVSEGSQRPPLEKLPLPLLLRVFAEHHRSVRSTPLQAMSSQQVENIRSLFLLLSSRARSVLMLLSRTMQTNNIETRVPFLLSCEQLLAGVVSFADHLHSVFAEEHEKLRQVLRKLVVELMTTLYAIVDGRRVEWTRCKTSLGYLLIQLHLTQQVLTEKEYNLKDPLLVSTLIAVESL